MSLATKAIYGADLPAAGGAACKPDLKFIGERASVQLVTADRKAARARRAG